MPTTEGAVVDKREQADKIVPFLLPTEQLFAVFDCKGAGTGFVAITDKRLMFYDKAPMRKRKQLTSIPFTRITSVSSVDAGSNLFGKASSELTLKAGGDEFEFEFWGGEKAQQAYQLILRELLQGEVS